MRFEDRFTLLLSNARLNGFEPSSEIFLLTVPTLGRRESKSLILSKNVGQKSLETEFSIAIRRPTGDKLHSKTLFLLIFGPRSSIVKSVFDCRLPGVVPRRCFFCGSFLLFMFRVCHAFLSDHCCLVVTCWEGADPLALVCDVLLCFLSHSHVVSWVRRGT